MLNAIEFSSEMTVKLVRHVAHDDFVVQAAQVSAKGENKPNTDPQRLINALLTGRHGSPFEHASFTFFVEVPIFVVREWQRHRISSFNEMSGRYTQLMPKFYVPAEDRAVLNEGTKMKPKFILDSEVTRTVDIRLRENSAHAWTWYRQLLSEDVAPEVARMVLPVNIYTQMYWTVNARSLMNFLSLRVESDDSLVRSYPQYEIDRAARKVEQIFAELMPATYAAFVQNGRVAP